jgi:hypothetical protein
MERIKHFLQEDECILWKKCQVKNYLIRIPLVIFLLGIIITSIALFFWYIPNWEGTFYIFYTNIEINPIISYLIVLSIFYTGITIALGVFIRDFKKGTKKLDLKLIDLKNYNEIFVLTNKRWIQKELNYSYLIDDSKFSPDILCRIKDMTFIDLNNLKIASLQKRRSQYTIFFCINEPSNEDFNQKFLLEVNIKEYNELIIHLNKLIPMNI